MKIFVVYSKVQFDKEPIPFNIFRKKYDEPYEPHITFTQPVYIDDSDVDRIKKLILELNKPKTKLNIKFTHTKESKDLLTIEVEKNEILIDLQNRISSLLSDYGGYVDMDTKQYEINFKPHITIARDVDKRSVSSIDKQSIESLLPLNAFINTVTLVVVDSTASKKPLSPENLTEYKF